MSDTTEGAAATAAPAPKPLIKLASLRNNTKKEADGEWKDSSAYAGGRFLLRSTEYPPYKIARDLLTQKLVRKANGKPLDPVKRDIELQKLTAEHLLLGWDGFDEPYSADLARDMAVDPEWREFFGEVIFLASRVAEVEAEYLEDAAKN